MIRGWLAIALAIALPVSRAQAQPAPALTSVEVVAVASDQYSNWDYIRGGIITPQDHGGRTLLVATREYGYTSSRIAVFNSYRMTEYRNPDPILNGNRAIIGYIRYWRFNGAFTSGRVTYQATSSVVPIRTLSTAVIIR